jgi:hypothetical protein
MPLRWLWCANVLKIEACEQLGEAIRAAQEAIPETWLAVFGEIVDASFLHGVGLGPRCVVTLRAAAFGDRLGFEAPRR